MIKMTGMIKSIVLNLYDFAKPIFYVMRNHGIHINIKSANINLINLKSTVFLGVIFIEISLNKPKFYISP